MEDRVYGYQNGLASDVYHHYVLRGRLSGFTFGDQIASGSIIANATYNKNYTFTISDATWNKNRLKVFTVLWKNNGTMWDIKNVNSVKTAPTVINNVPNAVDQLISFPNPATEVLNISGALTVVGDARILLVNAIGQTVFTKTFDYNGGQLKESIQVGQLANGVYNLVIQADGAQTMQKVVVNK